MVFDLGRCTLLAYSQKGTSFFPEFIIHNAIHHMVAVMTTDRNTVALDDDLIILNGLYFRNGYNKGFMDADESLTHQILFYVLEGKLCDVFSFQCKKSNVVL